MLRHFALVIPFLAAACTVTAESQSVSHSAVTEGASVDAEKLFTDGFSVITSNDCSADPTGDGCDVAVSSDDGPLVDPGAIHWAAYNPFALNLGIRPRDKKTVGDCAGKPNDCYTVYVFPAKIAARDYDDLGKQMREYAKLVGTLLHRKAKGPGEETWVSYQRSQAFSDVRAGAAKGVTAMCGAVVKSMIDSLVPEGSDFRQYGNCGEGGHVGACLATKAGFGDEEIRVCASDHDHFFGMVKHSDEAKKWCVMDRWNLINDENFECDVDWDKDKRAVTYKGEKVTQEWFTDVTCVTLKTYIANGASIE